MDFSILIPSDWIALFSTIVTLFTSLAAIILAYLSLKQSSDIIKDASLPKILVYADIVTSGSFQKYLIVHNYGGSPTKITSYTHSDGLHELDIRFLSNLVGSTIAPGQKIIHVLLTNQDESIHKINIGITYDKLSKKSKSESFVIDLNRLRNTFYTERTSTNSVKDEIAKSIYTLNDTMKQVSHNSEKQNL